MPRRQRRIRVIPQQKRKPDYRKLNAALRAFVEAQAEADAQAEHVARKPKRRRP